MRESKIKDQNRRKTIESYLKESELLRWNFKSI
jgi:hypothetical protein